MAVLEVPAATGRCSFIRRVSVKAWLQRVDWWYVYDEKMERLVYSLSSSLMVKSGRHKL